MAIIAIVAVAAVGGFYMLYSTSKPQANTNRGNQSSTSNTARNTPNPANAPAGAAIGINMIGSPTAVVTVEEFADFQCPSCAVAHPVMKDVQSAFAGNKNVRFIFRHLPLQMHDKAYDAASVVEAAGIQGAPKFWALMDQLMTNQRAWAGAPNYRELWRGYAEKIGLDINKWETDAGTFAARGRIDEDVKRAHGLGVTSTPSVFINNKPVSFSDVNVPTLRQLIEAEIEAATKAAAPAPANNGGNANSNIQK